MYIYYIQDNTLISIALIKLSFIESDLKWPQRLYLSCSFLSLPREIAFVFWNLYYYYYLSKI